jgi:hypothetical protein
LAEGGHFLFALTDNNIGEVFGATRGAIRNRIGEANIVKGGHKIACQRKVEMSPVEQS